MFFWIIFITLTLKSNRKRKVPFVGMMGWAVNSIAKAVEGSIPFLPINCKVVYSKN